MSNQRPSSRSEFKHDKNSKTVPIHFDNEGVCDACRYHERKASAIDWSGRREELGKLCDRYRRNDGHYDCVVPGSGGKDSVMAAHIIKNEFGMHPLTVTWAPHLYTDVGRRNLEHWIDSGFDNILFTPNGKVHRLLTRLAFKNLLHPFQPFILGQKNIGAKFAAMYDIPLVFYGESEAEYGNPIVTTQSALREAKYHTGENYENMVLGGTTVKELTDKYAVQMNELKPFLPMDPDLFTERNIQVHYLGYYVKWDPQEAYYFAVDHCGFEANDQRTEGTYSKYNSIDDKGDPFHYFTTLIKFGIGRATYDASQEIRNEKITREEGVALVKKFDREFPEKYFQEFLDYINMSEDEFTMTVDKARSPHLWKREGNDWVLRHTVWQQESATIGVL
jgi:N-acetyl sugar amidotransferase